MALDSDGNGYAVVKTVTGEGNKTYVKVKQVDDTSVKNYLNVKETDGEKKDYLEVVVVDYDSPKDYVRVNFIDAPVDSRWYMKFNGSSFARLNDTITLSGAFSIRVQTYMLNGGVSNAQLLGMSGDANVSLQVSSDGSMQVRTATTSRITASAGTFVFGQQNEVYVERFDDGSATLQVNGVEVGVSPSFGGDMVIDFLGRYASGSGGFTLGYVWDYELNGGAAGDVIIPLDEPFTEDHLIYDSNGNEIGVKSNDLEEDYTQAEPV